MSFKNNGRQRDFKKLLSALMCLIISIVCFSLMVSHGFSIGYLLFGGFTLYLAIAFFRTSNE